MTFKITAEERRAVLKRRQKVVSEINESSVVEVGSGIFMISSKKAIVGEISEDDVDSLSVIEGLEDESPDLYKLIKKGLRKSKKVWIVNGTYGGYVLIEKPKRVGSDMVVESKEVETPFIAAIKKPGILIIALGE